MIRVLVADDHPVVRVGLREILTRQRDIVVLGEAGTGAEVCKLVEQKAWDVIVLDVTLPDRSGQELERSVKTISTYRARILEKMDMQSNAQLVHYVLQRRLAEPV